MREKHCDFWISNFQVSKLQNLCFRTFTQSLIVHPPFYFAFFCKYYVAAHSHYVKVELTLILRKVISL